VNRIRVVVVTSTFPARPGDGTPEFVLTLSRALSDHCDVVVVAPRVPNAPSEERIGRLVVRRFRYFPRRFEGLADGAIMPNLRSQPWRIVEAPFLLIATILATLRAVRREHADLVHAHWVVPGGLAAVFTRWMQRIPFVLTVHGADAYALNGRFATLVRRAVMKRAATVLPVSTDIAARLKLATDEQHVVPMGVDSEAIRVEVGERTVDPDSLLFIGRLAEKKGVDVLIDALPSVPGLTARIAGDGPLREQLEDRARQAGVADRVTFLGTVRREEVMNELRRAALLVIPSKVAAGGDQEGTPVVLAEAAAAGLPVVASALGGLGEFVSDGNTGILVPPDDAPALANGLQRALTMLPDLDARARAARTAIGRLDVRWTCDRYLDAFSSALGRSGLGSSE
jgi:glycosyltransferase involved in cell wall biosynthesis